MYDRRRDRLVYLDRDLKMLRAVPVPGVSSGDVRPAVDPISDTLALASEADEIQGDPFVVVDRTTGRVLAREHFDSGNVLVHPNRPLLFMSFFRRHQQLIAYDLSTRTIQATAETSGRANRLEYWAARDELLVALPMSGRVARFDARSLDPRGQMKTAFGVRAVAVDEQRGLLLGISLLTGTLTIRELASGRLVDQMYLGPWLHMITLHPSEPRAFVTSIDAIFSVDYGVP